VGKTSIVTAIIGLVLFPALAHAQPMDSCSKQGDCINFEVTQIHPADLCATATEYQICATLDFSGSCVKAPAGDVAHTCVKPDDQCLDGGGFLGTTENSGVANSFTQCQIVSAEGTA
jgi:hypothetical protein